MSRTTEDAVKKILDTALTASEIDWAVNDAHVFLEDVLANEGYSDERREVIERWYAAHLVATGRDPRVKSMRTGEGNVTFHGESGMGLSSTPYGQQVLRFESNGVLAAMDKGEGDAEIRTLV